MNREALLFGGLTGSQFHLLERAGLVVKPGEFPWAIALHAVRPSTSTSWVGFAETATFEVVAAGNPAPTYQWQRYIRFSYLGGIKSYWINLAGATSATYTTPPTLASDNGANFRVVVGNGVQSPITSHSAVLTVR